MLKILRFSLNLISPYSTLTNFNCFKFFGKIKCSMMRLFLILRISKFINFSRFGILFRLIESFFKDIGKSLDNGTLSPIVKFSRFGGKIKSSL